MIQSLKEIVELFGSRLLLGNKTDHIVKPESYYKYVYKWYKRKHKLDLHPDKDYDNVMKICDFVMNEQELNDKLKKIVKDLLTHVPSNRLFEEIGSLSESAIDNKVAEYTAMIESPVAGDVDAAIKEKLEQIQRAIIFLMKKYDLNEEQKIIDFDEYDPAVSISLKEKITKKTQEKNMISKELKRDPSKNTSSGSSYSKSEKLSTK